MKIVGCLTTLPKRMIHLKETLESIKNQTQPLDILYLNIPWETQKGEKYDLDKLQKMLDEVDFNFKVGILRCKDFGSITKIIPVLEIETDPETMIITFDDDMVYDSSLVELLVKGSNKFPKAVIGTGGWIVGSFPFLYHSAHDKERKVDWLEGRTSILYRREFFGEYNEIIKMINNNCDDLFPENLKLHDDHILAYLTQKAPKMVVPGRKKLVERMNVRHIDSISGNAIKYLREAGWMVKILKEEGVYGEKMTWNEAKDCYGYTITINVLIITILIILISVFVYYYYFRYRRPSNGA
jgi:hypothetical protein